MKKILTWIKATGDWLHIWNYLWAFKPLIELSKWNKTYLMLADLHSLNSVQNWDTLRSNKLRILSEYFALLWDSNDIVVFEQSSIKRLNDISWVLNNVTPYSLMLRAHSFKDSQNKNSEISMWVFNYPILMAADIISYDIDIVPVWKDQKQHLEFARDIAGNFNKTYNVEFFKLPEHHIEEQVMTIPWTDGRKMSKSYDNFIGIFDDEKTLKKKIMSIVTDDKWLEETKDPDTCNVFALIKFFASKERQADIRNKYLAWNYWYWHAKLELLEIILDYFAEARVRYENYKNNPELIKEILDKWNIELNRLADTKCEELYKIVWLK